MNKLVQKTLIIGNVAIGMLVVVCVLSLWLYFQTDQELEACKKVLDTKQIELYNKDALLMQNRHEISILQKQNAELEREIQELKASRKVSCEVSAYSVGDSATPSNIMASGKVAYVGAVACNFLPIGTQIKIDGNIYTVEDRCGVDDCIDIYMETPHECNLFGRKVMEVEIL